MWPFKRRYRRSIWDQYNVYLTARNAFRSEKNTLRMRISNMTDGQLEREISTCKKRGASWLGERLKFELFKRAEARSKAKKKNFYNKVNQN